MYLGPASSSSSSNAAYKVKGAGAVIHFGKRGAPDYTTTHDEALKKRYLAQWQRRRRGRQLGPSTPAFWERWLLWNKPSKRASIRFLENVLHVKILPFPPSRSRRRRRQLHGGAGAGAGAGEEEEEPLVPRTRTHVVALPLAADVPTWDTIAFRDAGYITPPSLFFQSLEGAEPVAAPLSSMAKAPVTRVIAIGDIHADVDALLLNLFLAGVIDRTGGWTGGDTMVVQLGDQVDGKRMAEVPGECPELRVMQYVEHLKTEARAVGGDVVSLLGNHEMIWMTTHESAQTYIPLVTMSDWRWIVPSAVLPPTATPAEIEMVRTQPNAGQYNKRRELFRAGSGVLATKIMAGRGICFRVGNWIFSHGDTVAFLHKMPQMAELVTNFNTWSWEYLTTGRVVRSNPELPEELKLLLIGVIELATYEKASDVRAARAAAAAAERPSKQPRLAGGAPPPESPAAGPVGPLWDRGACHPQRCLDDIDPMMLRTTGYVSSHSVQNNSSINSFCGDRVWCVDTGRSFSFVQRLPSDDPDPEAFRFMALAARAQVLEIRDPKSTSPEMVVHRFAPPPGTLKVNGVFRGPDAEQPRANA